MPSLDVVVVSVVVAAAAVVVVAYEHPFEHYDDPTLLEMNDSLEYSAMDWNYTSYGDDRHVIHTMEAVGHVDDVDGDDEQLDNALRRDVHAVAFHTVVNSVDNVLESISAQVNVLEHGYCRHR